MATLTFSTSIDVVSKQRELVQEALGADGIYIRMKETLQEFFDDGDLKDSDKVKLISETLAALTNSITQSSMAIALQWAAQEKDFAIKKLELEKQLDILVNENALKEAQIAKIEIDSINAQSEARRMFGVPTIIDGKVTSLTNEGKLYQDIELEKQQLVNLGQEYNILVSKERESNAGVHKIIADTYRNYGSYSYTVDATGVSGVAATHGAYRTLSDVQEKIAQEQAKGYAYNAWASAASGLASTTGVALTSGEAIFDQGEIGYTMITNLNSTLNKLRNTIPPSF